MGERLSRAAAGLLAVALLAALLATTLEIWPPPNWPDDYPTGDDPWNDRFAEYEADAERYEGTIGSNLGLSLGFICDLLPLAWIAWRGTQGRKSRLMLAALAVHVAVGSVQAMVARNAEEHTAIRAAMWMLAVQGLWLAGYLVILSRAVRPRAAR